MDNGALCLPSNDADLVLVVTSEVFILQVKMPAISKIHMTRCI